MRRAYGSAAHAPPDGRDDDARCLRRPEGYADRGPACRPANHDALRPGAQEPLRASELHPRYVLGLGLLMARFGVYHWMHIACDAWPGCTRWRSNRKSGPGWSA